MTTQARLRQLLHYDQDTGQFTWLVRRGSAYPAGTIAGCKFHKRLNGKQYLAIRVDGKLYQNAARLAWLWMIGELPKSHIDHKNRDPLDNRWANLRLATASQNQANKSLQRNNRSGRQGVIFIPSRGKWRAGVSVGGKNKHVGYFDSRDDAYAAYTNAKIQHHGEFARVA